MGGFFFDFEAVRTESRDHDAPRRLIEEVGAKGQWRVIADRLRSGRSPGAVEQHWQIMTALRGSCSHAHNIAPSFSGDAQWVSRVLYVRVLPWWH